MVTNKNYTTDGDEDWDMVPEGTEEGEALLPPTAAPTITGECAPEEAVETESPAEAPLPSAPTEEDVMGLEEQQTMMGITDETSPEEIQRLMDSSTTNSVTDEMAPTKSPSGNPNENENERNEDTSNTPNNNPNLPAWLRDSLGAATKVVQDLDQKHDLSQKTRQGLDTVGSSLRQVGSTIQKETEGIRKVVDSESRKLSQSVQQKAEELDVQGKAKAATETIQTTAKTIAEGAKTAGDKAKELNKDGKLTQFVTAAAVVGASVFLASKGKPGASAAVLATGGAAYMASEAANAQRYDPGLNEDLHMD